MVFQELASAKNGKGDSDLPEDEQPSQHILETEAALLSELYRTQTPAQIQIPAQINIIQDGIEYIPDPSSGSLTKNKSSMPDQAPGGTRIEVSIYQKKLEQKQEILQREIQQRLQLDKKDYIIYSH